ncbi:hypothetical protein KYC5002_52175 [Archangium violaceum]|uniref:hypothetical protein n=1 Tax=Archangium violaceum TaxID=83451 RepID=UPI002B2F88A4|nr:hypothetical protein KYC5002_52175 [Archangium gephyra]
MMPSRTRCGVLLHETVDVTGPEWIASKDSFPGILDSCIQSGNLSLRFIRIRPAWTHADKAIQILSGKYKWNVSAEILHFCSSLQTAEVWR